GSNGAYGEVKVAPWRPVGRANVPLLVTLLAEGRIATKGAQPPFGDAMARQAGVSGTPTLLSCVRSVPPLGIWWTSSRVLLLERPPVSSTIAPIARVATPTHNRTRPMFEMLNQPARLTVMPQYRMAPSAIRAIPPPTRPVPVPRFMWSASISGVIAYPGHGSSTHRDR